MSFHWVALQLSTECKPDEALEHRRWLEFGLGTDADTSGTNTSRRRRQPHNEGVSKEPWVLWRVFLCYLSSREERWHPRRALPFEKRQIGSGAAGFCTARPAALHQSLRLVVAKSVNSVSAFGAKSSVHFLLPEGNPLGGLLLSPPNQVAQPSAALLRYGCGIPLAGTVPAGLRREPRWGDRWGSPKGSPNRGAVSAS